MIKPRLRLVTTNDFYGSFFPHVTSYGRLPGGRALSETVNRLREDAPTLWIDCGDFAQGGPLAPASGGILGFVAAGHLGIDVGTVGNHEFDWGEAHLRRWLPEAGFPLACANGDIGLPPSRILDVGEITVGVIGLTHPELAHFHPDQAGDQRNDVANVRDEAAKLRRQGVDCVVLALHDGADWAWTTEGLTDPRPARLEAVLAPLAGSIDAVLGGHTLTRLAGSLAGIPYVQPWAFGAEVGLVDFFPDGQVEVATLAVTGPSAWEGVGARLHDELERETAGMLAMTLVNAPMKERSLPAAVAEGMVRVTGAELALVSPAEFQTMQPPIDGAFAYLPAGTVSEADILRAIPWLDDGIYVAEVTGDEVECFVEVLGAPESWAAFGPPEAFGGIRGRTGALAISRWNARRVGPRLDRDVSWVRAGGQRDALRAFVSR